MGKMLPDPRPLQKWADAVALYNGFILFCLLSIQG